MWCDDVGMAPIVVDSVQLFAGKVNPLLFSLVKREPGALTTCACLQACVQTVVTQHTLAPASCSMCTQCLRTYSEHVLKNSWQVQHYLNAYSASSSVHRFPPAVLRALEGSIPSFQVTTPEERTSKALLHLQLAADLARAKWTQFNLPLSVLGLFVMLCCVVTSLAAVCAALLHHRLLSAITSLRTESCTFSGKVDMVFPLLSRHEGAAIGVVLLRAALPLSNSLVLAEAQVTQYFLFLSALIAGTTVYAQIRSMHRSQSKATTVVPCMSPYVSSSGAWFLLSHVWVRMSDKHSMALMFVANELKCHGLYLHLFSGLMPDVSALLSSIVVHVRTARIGILAIGFVVGSCGLLIEVRRRRFPTLPLLHRHPIRALGVIASFLVLLFHLRSKFVHQQNAPLRRKPVRLSLLELTRLVLFTASVLVCSNFLISVGGIDRIGLSPFHKTDQLHPQVLKSGTVDLRDAERMAQLSTGSAMISGWHAPQNGGVRDFCWYQWIYPVPALLCLSFVSHIVRGLPRRVAYCSYCGTEQCMPLRWRMDTILLLSCRLLSSVGLAFDAQVCPGACRYLDCHIRMQSLLDFGFHLQHESVPHVVFQVLTLLSQLSAVTIRSVQPQVSKLPQSQVRPSLMNFHFSPQLEVNKLASSRVHHCSVLAVDVVLSRSAFRTWWLTFLYDVCWWLALRHWVSFTFFCGKGTLDKKCSK